MYYALSKLIELVYQPTMYSDKEKQYWAIFLAVEGVGRQTFFSVKNMLQKHEVLWDEFWQKPDYFLKQIKKEKIIESMKIFKKEYTLEKYNEMLNLKGISVVSYRDFEYPQLLSETSDYPPILYVKNGPLPQMTVPIAFVGTRKMTMYGSSCIKKILKELSSFKPEIISGGMYGIDLCAHKTALSHGMKSIAVLGYGFNFTYPQNYSRIFDELLQQGLVLLSEFPPFIAPRPGNFPMRNRIVAGLSQGVVVVEAAAKSGSHITAQCALDEGRDVMAVPGPITSLYCEGTKWLCNQGATLVSSGQDVLKQLNVGDFPQGDTESIQKKSIQSLTVDQQSIINTLQNGTIIFDDLADELSLSSTELSILLSELEVTGIITISGDEVGLMA